ncbi:hypothetical protein K469DRAFT_132253 [Zopfia rhizophila CBS 207.26]|uniref:Uncharacterized protein n=1 Tax=Zopfia rhizophila CBS 207.26 TaxID=1314779 RepID=A0A6A6EXQ5_9PEZI|nr:hypothetical protein K469DRAFT_132253 [Zopfia rhizophila CBS 207.26]
MKRQSVLIRPGVDMKVRGRHRRAPSEARPPSFLGREIEYKSRRFRSRVRPHHIMDSYPLFLSLRPEAYEELFYSVLDPYNDPFIAKNPWADNLVKTEIELNPFPSLNLDAHMSLETQIEEMDTSQQVDASEAGQVPTHEKLPTESTNHLPDVLPEERTGVQVTEDEKTTRQDGDQDGNFKMTDEAPAETPAEDEKVEAPAETPAKDEKAAGQNGDQDTHLTMSGEAPLDPLAKETMSKPWPAAVETRLEEILKAQAGEVEEAISLGADQEFCPVMDEGARTEIMEAEVKEVTRVQATEDESDLSESEHQDQEVGPAVQNGESTQEHEPANRKTSEQSAGQGDPFARNNDILQEVLDVEVSGAQELGVEATASEGTDQDRGAAPAENTDGDMTTVQHTEGICRSSDRGSPEARAIEALENPKMSDGETGDSAAQSRSGEVEDEDREDGNVGKDAHGSMDNPILLDDDKEPPSQLSHEPILIDDDDEEPPRRPPDHPTGINATDINDEEKESSSQPPGRTVCRNKRKRKFEGSIPWANIEFQQQAASELDSAWQTTQIRWIRVKSFTKRVTGLNSELDVAITQFKEKMRRMCQEMEDKEEVDLESASELDSCWKNVEEKLRWTDPLRNKLENVKVWMFGRALGQLTEQAALYDCIREYPDSIDRKDEEEDEDFKVRCRYKVPRR